jgi:hypothetical protein
VTCLWDTCFIKLPLCNRCDMSIRYLFYWTAFLKQRDTYFIGLSFQCRCDQLMRYLFHWTASLKQTWPVYEIPVSLDCLSEADVTCLWDTCFTGLPLWSRRDLSMRYLFHWTASLKQTWPVYEIPVSLDCLSEADVTCLQRWCCPVLGIHQWTHICPLSSAWISTTYNMNTISQQIIKKKSSLSK